MTVARYKKRGVFLVGNEGKNRFVIHPSSGMLRYGKNLITKNFEAIRDLQADVFIQHGTRHYATCSVAK